MLIENSNPPTHTSRHWHCSGSRKKRHAEIKVKNGESCPDCGATKPEKKTGRPILPLIGALATGAVVVAAVGSYWRWGQVSRPSTPSTPAPSLHLTPAQVEERVTSGEHSLFRHHANPDKELGMEAFRLGDYGSAMLHFQNAHAGTRSDPESLIFFNNARARLVGDPFVVGTVVPTTNKVDNASEMLRGLAMAQDIFNSDDGAGGRLLEVRIGDDGNDPGTAQAIAEFLVRDRKLLAVVGHNNSDATAGGLPVYERAGMPLIVPTSTSTELGGSQFFRALPSDDQTGGALARHVVEQGHGKVIVFFDTNSRYSNSLEQAFTTEFSNLGGEFRSVALNEAAFSDRLEVPHAIFQDKATAAILLPSTATTAIAIRVARRNLEYGSNRMALFGADAIYSFETLHNGGEAVVGMTLAVPWFAGIPAAQRFAETSANLWGGRVSWRTATTFDATQALTAALQPNMSRSDLIGALRTVVLSGEQTSGNPMQFGADGGRLMEPTLVRAVRGATLPFDFEVVQREIEGR